MLILAAVLLCQSPPPDHGFTRAVEEFAMAAAPGPAPDAAGIGRRVAGLGADCWRCRERAGRVLRADGAAAVPWLVRGLHSADAQVRLSCWLILRDVAGCAYCRGTGTCQGFAAAAGAPELCGGCGGGPSSHEGGDWSRRCVPCAGIAGKIDMTDIHF